ncbi:RNA-directed DNA polymerase [Arhodomonas sp. KWT]
MHARGGLLRRKLSICHPVLYYLLSREVDSNWASIVSVASGSALAATAPDKKSTGRAIDGKFTQGDRANLAITTRIGRRFILSTDISRFYHSIYTHSIPWALHTKPVAKANHTFALLGNKLDFLVRQGQDGQTVGIPIGPDVSLVLAELIMHRCDTALTDKLPNIKGHRFIDDYELSFKSRTEAEEAFHLLEICLSEYELALNPKKTKVSELPTPLESAWARELKTFQFRTSKRSQAADLEAFFSLAFELHRNSPGEPVLQFAIARLRSVRVDKGNWELFQRLILLCVTPEPATLPYALEQIISRVNAGYVPLMQEIQDILNNLIETHAPLRHSSEVANSLWGCLALKLRVQDQAADLVSSCEDSCVALLALDCQSKGLVSKPLRTGLWETQMCAEGLYDEQWLLAYEANVKGWLPSIGGADHVRADPNFGYLKANGVHFYEETRASPVQGGRVPSPALPSKFVQASYQSV